MPLLVTYLAYRMDLTMSSLDLYSVSRSCIPVFVLPVQIVRVVRVVHVYHH